MKKPVSVANLEAKIVLGVLTLALAGATVGITLWLVDEHSSRAEAAVVETGEEAATETQAEATTETETEATTEAETEATTEAETEAATEAETETEAETGGGGDAAAGAEVFASAGCGSCHTLADAGTSGTVGPDLDELQPNEDAVAEQVTNGGGGMPAFADQLSEQQIADVAAYVSSVAGA